MVSALKLAFKNENRAAFCKEREIRVKSLAGQDIDILTMSELPFVSSIKMQNFNCTLLSDSVLNLQLKTDDAMRK
jgi:hypothetical protein